MDYYLGTILLFAFNWAPVYTLPCDGRLLDIRTNTALFSLLNTTYGGDGVNNFALPDLRGAEPCPGTMYCIVTSGLYPVRD